MYSNKFLLSADIIMQNSTHYPVRMSELTGLQRSSSFQTKWCKLEKLAQLHLPDYVYNWLADFFTGHSHCTVYHGQVSTLKSITASIIQGSGIGPAAYVVNASDLKAVTSATNCASSPTTPTSSSQPATSTRGQPR